jgi:hypothetical protein
MAESWGRTNVNSLSGNQNFELFLSNPGVCLDCWGPSAVAVAVANQRFTQPAFETFIRLRFLSLFERH